MHIVVAEPIASARSTSVALKPRARMTTHNNDLDEAGSTNKQDELQLDDGSDTTIYLEIALPTSVVLVIFVFVFGFLRYRKKRRRRFLRLAQAFEMTELTGGDLDETDTTFDDPSVDPRPPIMPQPHVPVQPVPPTAPDIDLSGNTSSTLSHLWLSSTSDSTLCRSPSSSDQTLLSSTVIRRNVTPRKNSDSSEPTNMKSIESGSHQPSFQRVRTSTPVTKPNRASLNATSPPATGYVLDESSDVMPQSSMSLLTSTLSQASTTDTSAVAQRTRSSMRSHLTGDMSRMFALDVPTIASDDPPVMTSIDEQSSATGSSNPPTLSTCGLTSDDGEDVVFEQKRLRSGKRY